MNRKKGFASACFNIFKKGLTNFYLISLFALCIGYCMVIAGDISLSDMSENIMRSFFSLILVIIVLRLLLDITGVILGECNIASGIAYTLSYDLGCVAVFVSFMRCFRQINVCSIDFVERYTYSVCVLYCVTLLMTLIGRMIDDRLVLKKKE